MKKHKNILTILLFCFFSIAFANDTSQKEKTNDIKESNIKTEFNSSKRAGKGGSTNSFAHITMIEFSLIFPLQSSSYSDFKVIYST